MQTSTRRFEKRAQNGVCNCVGGTTKTQPCNTNCCPTMYNKKNDYKTNKHLTRLKIGQYNFDLVNYSDHGEKNGQQPRGSHEVSRSYEEPDTR